ncbi:MAG: outer membrane protein, partial [Helicobacter sp.]|nr:outer membrane protein [Helicobacter sp.]
MRNRAHINENRIPSATKVAPPLFAPLQAHAMGAAMPHQCVWQHFQQNFSGGGVYFLLLNQNKGDRMKKMACIAIAAALIAAAAADGAFVGISLGRTQASAKIKNDGAVLGASGQIVETNITTPTPRPDLGNNIYQQEINTTQSAIGRLTREFLQSSDSHDTKGEMSYGILAGYRWFLGENFAVRGLAEFDYQPAKLKGEIPGSNKLNAMLFIVGADVLGYFNRSDSAQFGVFAGIGVAYHRYDL